MKISNTGGGFPNYQPTTKKESAKVVDFSLPIDTPAQDESVNLREIVAKYDLSNISFNEIQKLGGELHRAGFLSVEEVADFERSALPVPDFLPGIRANDRVDRLAKVQGDLEYSAKYQLADVSTLESAKRTKAVFDKVLSLLNTMDLRG
jgi:hypothetical protein